MNLLYSLGWAHTCLTNAGIIGVPPTSDLGNSYYILQRQDFINVKNSIKINIVGQRRNSAAQGLPDKCKVLNSIPSNKNLKKKIISGCPSTLSSALALSMLMSVLAHCSPRGPPCALPPSPRGSQGYSSLPVCSCLPAPWPE